MTPFDHEAITHTWNILERHSPSAFSKPAVHKEGDDVLPKNSQMQRLIIRGAKPEEIERAIAEFSIELPAILQALSPAHLFTASIYVAIWSDITQENGGLATWGCFALTPETMNRLAEHNITLDIEFWGTGRSTTLLSRIKRLFSIKGQTN